MGNTKKTMLLLLLFLSNAQLAFSEQRDSSHVGLDVLNPDVDKQLTRCLFNGVAGETENWRPSYVLNGTYPLADVSGQETINLYVTGSGNAYLYRGPLKSHQVVKYPGYLELSLADATKIWGLPKRHVTQRGEYLIFDVYNSPHEDEEKNLYHIDVKVDSKDQIVGYRVRGISIPNSGWITSQTLAASLDR